MGVGGVTGEAEDGQGDKGGGRKRGTTVRRLAHDAYVHGRASARTSVAVLHIELARRIEY